VLITEETEKTIKVNFQNRIAWLQKSLVKLKIGEGNNVTLTIPFWLFTLKFPKQKKSKTMEKR
jgi:hypothetical protein